MARQQWAQYQQEDMTYRCPQCPPDAETFDSLQRLKTHMAKEHGGYDSSDIASAVPQRPIEETGGVTPKAQEGAPPSPPKKTSRLNRELNEAMNEGLTLCVRHMTAGLDEIQKARLAEITGKITTAVMGVEFDFEQKIVSVSGKFWLILGLALLYVVPRLPTWAS